MLDVVAQNHLAGAAQATWGAQPLPERLAVLQRLRPLLVARSVQLATAVPASCQRSLAETLLAEVLPLIDACRFLERRAAHILAPRRLGRRGRPLWLTRVVTEIRREPLGVVVIIGPANYPLLLPGVQMLQALAAGNAVLCKPGHGGQAVLSLLASCLHEAGLAADLVQVLPEDTMLTAPMLHSGIAHVVLTGSGSTGATVLAALAPHLIPATLELSGCDAAFVRADADLELTAQALAFGLRFNGGATCIVPRRVFVAQACAAALEQRLVALAATLPPCQLKGELAIRVHGLIQEACQAGGRLCAGSWQTLTSCTPLLVAQATPAMRLLQEEVMAPVLALVVVRDDEEALAAASRCAYALGATVFGAEAGARALARRVRAGVVVVNDMLVPTADPRLPFGGRGRSGFGVTRGAEGLLALTAIKAIAVRRGSWRPHFAPLREVDRVMVQAYIAAAHGASLRQRVQAMGMLVRHLLARRQGHGASLEEEKA